MRKRLIVANWKMYIETPDTAKRFITALKRKLARMSGVEVWIAPPFTILPTLPKGSYKLGGQAVSAKEGAHTGQVSAGMLRAAGASFCIVGHSEQRAQGADAEAVRAQFASVLKQGMVGILCVGEEARKEDGSHFAQIEEEIRSACTGMQAFANKIIVAYEPIWAIGASQAMQPQELEETVIFIKKTLSQALGREGGLKIPILYGGSVEGGNAHALLASGVSGFLVGRASADINSFGEILTTCKK